MPEFQYLYSGKQNKMFNIRLPIEADETIKGLFKEIKQDYREYKLNEIIMQVVVQILGVSVDYEITTTNLIDYMQKLDIIKTDENLLNCCKLAP